MMDRSHLRRRSWGEHPLSLPGNLSWAIWAVATLCFLPMHHLPVAAWIVCAVWFLVNVVVTWRIWATLDVPLEPTQERKPGDEVRGTSLFRDALQRLRRNQAATLSAGILVIMVILCFGQSFIARVLESRADALRESGETIEETFWTLHFDHTRLREDQAFSPPSARHWFGTDSLGRDVFARTLYGGTISFLVAIVATAVSLMIGVSWGAIAGYLGGRVDHYMMRFVDILYGLPFMFLVILILTLVNGVQQTASKYRTAVKQFDAALEAGDSERAEAILEENNLLREDLTEVRAAVFLDNWVDPMVAMFFALGLVSWLTMARIARGQVLTLREREFIIAARTIGARTPRIIFLHVVPNLLGPVIVYTTLTIPTIMLSEAFLSFLGLGISAPRCSWGSLASTGWREINVIKPYWWPLAYPTAAMFLTLFSLNFIGDGLRDALDPKLKR